MTVQAFKVMDRTTGDADTVPGTVLIHDLVGHYPSMITYEWEIAEALEELSGVLPEEQEHLPQECEDSWIQGNDIGELSGLEAALGIRIEHFEDFLEEHSRTWTTIGGRVLECEPSWTYPDDVDD